MASRQIKPVIDLTKPSEWVALELGPKADGEDPDLIKQSIRHHLRDADVFIPASVTQVGGDRVIQYLLEGYAFIRRAHAEEKYYRLEGSKYVQGVISHVDRSRFRSTRRIAYVPDHEVSRLRRQIEAQENQGIEVGDLVLILSGPYRLIKAKVIEDIPEKDEVQVYIQLRSKESLITFPRAGLRLVAKGEKNFLTYQTRWMTLQQWGEAAFPVMQWSSDGFDGILDGLASYTMLDVWTTKERTLLDQDLVAGYALDFDPLRLELLWGEHAKLSTWISAGQKQVNFLRAMSSTPSTEHLLQLGEEVQRLSRWTTAVNQLVTAVRAFNITPSLTPIESRYLELEWLQDIQLRLKALSDKLTDIEDDVEDPAMTQNLIIDGNNLAVRCGRAPGLDQLKDKQGRPSGVVTGFLRSLGALRKRFPKATIYVCWDYSSQRRMSTFPGYKAGRTPFEGRDQIEWLKAALPSFGVVQAYNEVEEADDAIATLVSGRLKEDVNVILSNDRDLLQLVTATTTVLAPSSGLRPEKLFDVDAVKEEYGVPPGKMVYFRAMSGDSSDKIPGVFRLQEKTIVHLIRTYGSIDGVFSSSLPELTKSQQEKIRASEAQVRKNVGLMALVSNLDLTFVHPMTNPEAASKHLQDVDVKVEPMLTAFFRLAESPTNTT